MKFKHTIVKFLVFCMVCIFWNNLYAQEKGVIIVNKNVPIESLSRKELKKIYLGKKNFWSNQVKIQAYQMPLESDLSKSFIKKLIKTSTRKFNRYWLKKVFSGSAVPPTTVNTSSGIIDFVSQNSGGIGYIPESEARSINNCKIIKVDTASNF